MASQQENIFDVSSDVLDVDALKSISVNAKEEESSNLEANINALSNEKEHICLPYPDVGPFDTGSDYDEIADLQYKKRCNQPSWNKIKEIDRYLDVDALYNGHLSCFNGKEYYFVDSFLSSKLLQNDNVLVSVNDAAYNEIFKKWKFPKKGDRIRFSRNIDIHNKHVDDVTIIYDDSNAVFSSISDLFLRNVLIKNKTNNYIQSIIQTIQEKQNEIRIYDGNSSIVVQGCAGSGKTMVLLHRFKYLKYNEAVSGANYALLVPSENFKGFINTTANEFGIYTENVFTYTEYYRFLLNEKDRKWQESNELNFSEEYLSFVYSESFIKECYSYLIEYSRKIINETIDFCDEKLSCLITEEKQQVANEINRIKEEAVRKVNLIVAPIQIFDKQIEEYSDLESAVEFIEKYYYETVSEIEQKTLHLRNEVLSEGIVKMVEETNFELVGIRDEIEVETNKYNKASIFTKVAHKLKLNSLKAKYEAKRKEIIDNLYNERKKENEEKIAALKYVNGGISIDEIGNAVKKVEQEYGYAKRQISSLQTQVTQYDEKFSKKYEEGIKALQDLIKISADADNCYPDSMKHLKQCKNLVLYTSFAIKVAKLFDDYKSNAVIEMPEAIKLMIVQKADNYVMLFNEIFNIARKIIKERFNIAICKRYKHYWFLKIYFSYLLGGIVSAKEFLFIDEAQDLSPVEINLLHKLNTLKGGTVCNLFGDVKQVISSYGVKNWKQFQFIDKSFILDENFRNTNQIIEYCEKNIKLTMKPVGVSMQPVKEFKAIDDVFKCDLGELVFIVKDEYAVENLVGLLKQKNILDYKVFAVKEVKGLEFKQVVVFDGDMTVNEKYIAYTRALIQLYVVKNLPWSGEKRIHKIIQTDEE